MPHWAVNEPFSLIQCTSKLQSPTLQVCVFPFLLPTIVLGCVPKTEKNSFVMITFFTFQSDGEKGANSK